MIIITFQMINYDVDRFVIKNPNYVQYISKYI